MQHDELVATELRAVVRESYFSKEMAGLVLTCLGLQDPQDLKSIRYKWANLTFASCEFLTGAAELALHGAVAMELFALAADILDDIQDEDNDLAPWRKIPVSQAISLATAVLVLSYQALGKVADPLLYRRVMQILNETGLRASNGQFLEVLYDQRNEVTLDEYLELIGKKSGSLTAAACKMGGVLGGASPETADRLAQFGVKLGQIAQVDNDLRDFHYTGDKSDLSKGKKTLPFVYLMTTLEGATAEQFKCLIKSAQEKTLQFGPEQKQKLVDILLHEGGAHYCLVVQEMFRQEALKILETIPVPDSQKGKLSELV